MTTIFIVEDHQPLIQQIQNALQRWQYQVQTVHNWQNVANEIHNAKPNLILFDLTLPTFDGYYWIHEVRKQNNAPIIVISAGDIDQNIMRSITTGADDYIMKPFSMAVLLAKIQAQLRRFKDNNALSDNLTWEENQFNPLTNVLSNPSGQIKLSPTEGAMMTVLINHLGQTVSKDQLLEWLWQGGKFLNQNTLSVNISRLRAKLTTIDLADTLRTDRGLGYRLVKVNEK
ncbi:MAG TPA: response regulator transcription factor [Candidatus Limosilactobacillus excrementigallinarum]|nr:response regulator transcription factor [Candidatus Limosilactobacillus excrementigallinarum]